MIEAKRLVIGIDLGQVSDPTAIVVVEVTGARQDARFDVRHMERHLGKPYTAIVARVKTLTERLGRQGEVIIGFDRTGVGMAVSDMLRAADVEAPLYGVTIVAGETMTREGQDFHVPKRDLIAVLQVAFQGGRVRIAKMALTDLFIRELLSFRVRVTSAANEVLEAQSGAHDDFVLAASIACWLAGEVGPRWDMEEYARLAEEGAAAESVQALLPEFRGLRK